MIKYIGHDLWVQCFSNSRFFVRYESSLSEELQVGDAMLRMESVEVNVTFFAAQTIHAKVHSNVGDLPRER